MEAAETIEDAFAVARPSVDTDPVRTEGTSVLYAARNACPVDQVLCTMVAVLAAARNNLDRVSLYSHPGEDSEAFALSVEEAYVALAGPVVALAAAIARSSPAVSSVGSLLLLPPLPRCCTSGSSSDAATSTVNFCSAVANLESSSAATAPSAARCDEVSVC